MATYSYRCDHCGEEQVRVYKMGEMPAWVKCSCCKKRAKRVYYAPAVHFKGNGFYNTDYKNASKKDPPKEDKPPQEVKQDADKKTKGTK